MKHKTEKTSAASFAFRFVLTMGIVNFASLPVFVLAQQMSD
jgi:hypothetical protein